ncbi:FAD/NAD(P)-binding protein [Apiospora kogelbergensis]|uniref:FAD/NAD(P)-binding protein n=1 Tax=Apiospora kogelbergensis TaxID=1337665 RepID=UPI00312F7FA0
MLPKSKNLAVTRAMFERSESPGLRPHRSDWDALDTPGWSAADLIPYLKKHDTYHGKDEQGLHGHHGPIQVSDSTYKPHRIADEFATAVVKMGWSNVDDLSDLDSTNPVGRAKRFISPDGKRQDTVTCYLHPRLQDGKHPNLHVLVQSQVNRILFDENRNAVGVEFQPSPLFSAEASPLQTVKAKKLVIASAGAIGTPSLLERSGLGDSEVLKRAGIPLVAELPGVGEGYENHQLLGYPYLNNLSIGNTLDGLVFGGMGSHEDLIKSNHKMMGWNGKEMQAKIRPTDDEEAVLGPEGSPVARRGYGINAKCRQARFHPPSAAGSDAALVELGDSPLPADAPEIRYTPEDDAVIAQWIRGNVGTTWHSLRTCKMQPREKMGVVDPTLSVYGVQGLKIADMSIAPRNVSANTCDTAITIGEKAADIFI